MRMRMIAGGLFALGLTAFIPAMAQAKAAPERRTETRTETHQVQRVEPVKRDVHIDRPVIRDEHVVVDRDRIHDRYIPAPVIQAPYIVAPSADFDVAVNLDQVPGCVIAGANRETGGAPIVGIDYVRNGGSLLYYVHVQGNNGYRTARIGINGGFWGWA